MIALVPERRDKRGRRIGHNWWREFITAEFYAADHAWWLERERVALGYTTEMREFAASHPRPTLKGFMLAHAGIYTREEVA